MNKSKSDGSRTISFFEDKGLYIVLFLCILAIGITCYVLFAGPETAPTPASRGNSNPTVPSIPTTPIPTLPDIDVTASVDPPVTEPSKEAANPVPKSYRMPVNGDILRPFSDYELKYDETMDDWRTHNGCDIACPRGSDVLAMDNGKVEKACYDELTGGVVVLSHPDGLTSIYCGLSNIPEVTEGDSVTAGDCIGKTDSIKCECLLAPHLHWEVIKDGSFIDPLSLNLK